MKKTKKGHQKNYSLEPLEKRLLLSAETLVPSTALAGLDFHPLFSQSHVVTIAENSPQFDVSFSTGQINQLETETSEAVRNGLANLRNQLANLAQNFNAEHLNLPLLPGKLNNLFGLESWLEAHKLSVLPEINPAATARELVDALHGHSFDVIAIKGGLSELGIADTTDGSLIQFRLQKAVFADLPLSAAYDNETVNNNSQSLLEGLASELHLQGQADWQASFKAGLDIKLEVSVSESGETFLLDGSNLILRIGADGTLSGHGTLSNQTNTGLSAQASADMLVNLHFKAQENPLNVLNIVSSPLNSVHVTASGQASAAIDFTLGPAHLTFQADYTMTENTDTMQVSQDVNISLHGDLKLPGLTVPGSGEDAVVAVNGTIDPITKVWTISATADNLHLFGFEINDLQFNINAHSTDFAGSLQANLTLDFLKTATGPVTSSINMSFDNDGFKLDSVFNAGSIELHEKSSQTADAKIIYAMTDTVLTFDATGNFTSHSYGGFLNIEADGAQLFPGNNKFSAVITTDQSKPEKKAFKGNFDFTAETISFEAAKLDFTIKDICSFSSTGVVLSYHYHTQDRQKLAGIEKLNLKLLAFSDQPEIEVLDFSLFTDGFAFTNMDIDFETLHIGSFLQAGKTNFVLENIEFYRSSGLSGNFHFTTLDSVRILPSVKGFTAVIKDGADADNLALSGSLSFDTGNFSINFDQFELNVDRVFKLSGGPSQITYSPAVAGEQTLFSLENFLFEFDVFKVNNQALSADGKNLIVTTTGFSLDNLHLPATGTELGEIAIGNGKTGEAHKRFVSILNPAIVLENIRADHNGLSGVISVSAKEVDFLPDQTGNKISSQINDTDGDNIALQGTLTLGENGVSDFVIDIDHAVLTVANSISFELGGTPGEPARFSPFADIFFHTPLLGAKIAQLGLGGNLADFEIHHSGLLSATGFGLDFTEANHKMGLANFLPITLNYAEFVFLNSEGQPVGIGEKPDLSNFELAVRGNFDLSAITNHLFFTPVLKFGQPGDADYVEISDHGTPFSFSLREFNGELSPWNIPSITIGISELKIGKLVEIGGQVTLGGFVNGDWTGEVGGFLEFVENNHVHSIKKNTVVQGALAGTNFVTAGLEDLKVEINPGNSSFDIHAGKLDLSAVFSFSFGLGDFLHFTNTELDFSFKATADIDNFTFALHELGLQGSSFDEVSFSFKNWLNIVAENGSLNFNPANGEHIADFGNLTASVPKFGLSVGVQNVGITEDGLPLAAHNFGFSFKGTKQLLDHLHFPTWIPIPVDELAVVVIWSDFNQHPADFKVELSADVDVTVPGTTLGVTGGIAGLEVVVNDDGNSYIDKIEGFELSLNGNLGEFKLSGAIAIGMYKFDADGEVIDPTDIFTTVEKRVLYGLFDGEAAILGYKYAFRLALCNYGPVGGFLEASAPIPVGGPSGIGIESLYAQFKFGAQDLINVTKPSDLKNIVLPSDQTPKDWMKDMENSIKALAKEDVQGENMFAALAKNFSIEGGITIYDIYSENLIELTGDVRLDTTGRMLISGALNISGYLEAEAMMYLDLSKLPPEGPTDKVEGAVMLYCALPRSNELKAAPLSFYGEVRITGETALEQLSIEIDGGITFSADGFFEVTVLGDATLVVQTQMADRPANAVLNVDGELDLTGIGKALGVAGQLDMIFHKSESGNSLDLWGALVMKPEKLAVLESIGLHEDAIAIYQINLCNTNKTVTLDIPGQSGPQDFQLRSQAAGMLIEGIVSFKAPDGKDWFDLHGSVSIYEGVTYESGTHKTGTHADVVVDAELLIGPSAGLGETDTAANAWFVFDALGYMYIDPLNAFAGELALSLKEGGSFGAELKKYLDVSGNLLFQFNTTKLDIDYTVPTLLSGADKDIKIALSAGPVDILEPDVSSAPAAWALLQLDNATLTFNQFILSGDMDVLVSTELLEIKLNDQLLVGNAGNPHFTLDVKGTLKSDDSGMVGRFILPAEFQGKDETFSLVGTGHFLVNTTGSDVILADGTFVPGRDDGNPYLLMSVDGFLHLNKPYDQLLSIDGVHEFTAVSNAEGPGYQLVIDTKGKAFIKGTGPVDFRLFEFDMQGRSFVNETGLFAYLETVSPSALVNEATGGYAYQWDRVAIGINTTFNDIEVLHNGGQTEFKVLPEGSITDSGFWLPSRVGAHIRVDGGIQIFDHFVLRGEYGFLIDDNIWTLKAEADAIVYIDKEQKHELFKLPFVREIQLKFPGIVFNEQFSLSSEHIKLANFDLSGDFNFVVNTTKETFPEQGINDKTFARLDFNNGHLHVDGFDLKGNFNFLSNALSSLSANGDFELELNIEGHNIFRAAASSELHFGFDGFATRINIASPKLAGFNLQELDQIDKEFCYMEINTSRSDFTFTEGNKTYTIKAGPYAVVSMHSGMKSPAFAGMEIRGDIDLTADGQLTFDALTDFYAFGKKLFVFEVSGGLTHNHNGTLGRLQLKEGSQPLIDFPDDWGLSFGKESTTVYIDFSISPDDAGDDALHDGITVEIHNQLRVALLEIDGVFKFKWSRGDEFILAVGGSTWLGFGERDSAGKPHYNIAGFDLGGEIGFTEKGVFGGFEVDVQEGTVNVDFLEKLGLDLGFNQGVKTYFRVNTTGEEQNLSGLPAELSKLEAGHYGEIYFVGTQKLVSLFLEGAFGFRVQSGGFRVLVDADIDISFLKSSEHSTDHATQITLLTAEVDGFFDLSNKGMLGFLRTTGSNPNFSILGFEKIDLGTGESFLLLNTTDEAVNVRDFMPDLPHDIPDSVLAMPAGKYAELFFKLAYNIQGLKITGYAGLEIMEHGVMFFGENDLSLSLIDNSMIDVEFFQATAGTFIYIGSDGVAALSVTTASPWKIKSDLGFDFSNTAVSAVMINATDKEVNIGQHLPADYLEDFAGYTVLEAGEYAKVLSKTTLTEKVSAVGTGFEMSGDFELWLDVDAGCLAGKTESKMEVEFLGLGKQVFDTSGDFVITRHGIAFQFKNEVEGSAVNLSGNHLTIGANDFYVTVNTTGHDISTLGIEIAGKGGAYAQLEFKGEMNFLGWKFNGDYTLFLGTAQQELKGLVDFSLFDHQLLKERIDFILTPHGAAGVADLNFTKLSLPGVFDIDGTYKLRLNTTDHSLLGVSPQSFAVHVSNAELGLAGIKASGSLIIDYHNGDFKIDIPSSSPLHSHVSGFDFYLSGWLHGTDFSLSAEATAIFGDKAIADLSGKVAAHVSRSGGFAAVLSGDLYIFGHKTGHSVHETVKLDDFKINFHINPSIQLPGAFSFINLHSGHGFSGYISNHGVVADIDAVIKIHGTQFGSIKGHLDTINKNWYLKGHSHIYHNIIGLDLNMDLDVDISNHGHNRVHVGASVSKSFRLWTPFHHYNKTYGGSASGDISAGGTTLHGTISNPVHDIHFTINLKGGSLLKASDLAGYTVFLDTNGNRQQDEFEPLTIADESGHFSFEPSEFSPDNPVYPDATSPALGVLQPFDLNGNGLIDKAEGMLVITGGYDIHTGAANTVTFVLSASDYGSLIAPVASPLSLLHELATQKGVESDTAWSQIKSAFGINYMGDLNFFDPNHPDHLTDDFAAHLMVERAYLGINTYLLNAHDAISIYLQGQNAEMQTDYIHNALLEVLAEKVMTVEHYDAHIAVDADEKPLPLEAKLDMSSFELTQELVNAAFVKLGIESSAKSGELAAASAHISSVQMDYALALEQAGVINSTEAFSRIKYLAQNNSDPFFLEIMSGELSLSALQNAYNTNTLLSQLQALDIPYENSGPEIFGLNDLQANYDTQTEAALVITDPDGLPEHVHLQANSSDERVLANSDITIIGTGAERTISFKLADDFAGLSTITLTATDNFADNNPLLQTVQVLSLTGVEFGQGEIVKTGNAFQLEIPVQLTIASNQDVAIYYAESGNATAGEHYQKSSGSILIKAGETTGTIAVNLLSSPMEDGISLNITPTEFTNAYALSTAAIETTLPSPPPVVVSPQNSSSGGHNIFDNTTSSRTITASSAAASSAAAMTGLQMADITSNLKAENTVEEMLNPEEETNTTETTAKEQATTITGSQSAPQGNRAISRSQNRSITPAQPEHNMTDHNTRTEAADYADSGLEDDFSGAV